MVLGLLGTRTSVRPLGYLSKRSRVCKKTHVFPREHLESSCQGLMAIFIDRRARVVWKWDNAMRHMLAWAANKADATVGVHFWNRLEP